MSRPDLRARLIERLLSDPGFRARFQADPAAAAREAGFDGLADELARLGAANPMQTLDYRESRSSLAGVLMAAAVEGLGIYELGKHVLDPVEDAQAATGRAPGERSPSGEVPTASASSSDGWDPDQFGQRGSGGPVTAETLSLLRNRRVVLDASGVADVKAGRIDPRVVALLQRISEKHRISVSSMSSDHPRLTVNGSVSNHAYGRAFDISVVDGRPVGPGNVAARRLALELSRVTSRIRPSEIGSPWNLPGASYFTDGDHQDHLHVGFDDPIASGWKPPGGSGPAPLAAAAQLPPDPDDWEGNLDDEDAGADEADGSNEDEPDEDGGEDDDGGTDDEESDDDESDDDSDDDDSDDEDSDEDEEDSDDDQDAPGEGSSGEDADDEDSDGDDSDSEDSDDGDSDDGDSDDGGSGEEPVAAAPEDGDLDLGAVDGYPGDEASRQEFAAWMGAAAQKRGLPPELPVMAALVESGLRPIDYGDADSVGFFQMRLSIWNQGPYRGYPDRPERQLDWFLDQAVAVKKLRIERGLPVGDPRHYGEWIADVERPAAQYRGRYQLRLEEARALLPRVGDDRRGAEALLQVAEPGAGLHAGRRALIALAEAQKQLGNPYLWGGSSPETGFDCSGLVQWAYAKAGISIPRVTDQQILAAGGTPVGRRELVPGDLVFFRDASGYVHHVGMSLGGDRFLHSPRTGDVVKISSLEEPYYAQQFTGGRRFDEAAPARTGAAPPVEVRPSAADAEAIKLAQALLERDAAEVRHLNSALFQALERQERGKGDFTQVLSAVDPSRARLPRRT